MIIKAPLVAPWWKRKNEIGSVNHGCFWWLIPVIPPSPPSKEQHIDFRSPKFSPPLPVNLKQGPVCFKQTPVWIIKPCHTYTHAPGPSQWSRTRVSRTGGSIKFSALPRHTAAAVTCRTSATKWGPVEDLLLSDKDTFRLKTDILSVKATAAWKYTYLYAHTSATQGMFFFLFFCLPNSLFFLQWSCHNVFSITVIVPHSHLCRTCFQMGDQLPKIAEKQSRGDSSWEHCSMSRLSGGSKTNSSQLQSSSSDKLCCILLAGEKPRPLHPI